MLPRAVYSLPSTLREYREDSNGKRNEGEREEVAGAKTGGFEIAYSRDRQPAGSRAGTEPSVERVDEGSGAEG